MDISIGKGIGYIVQMHLLCAYFSTLLRTVRTEYGKRIRKSYEKGELDISRWDFLVYEPRLDGISNTLTGVQKDNLLLVGVPEDV